MPRHFRHHDQLRLFVEIARHSSFSDAASALNMTKGAISYQIKTLEDELAMTLFDRTTRGVALTGEGLKLLAACQSRFEEIEADILALKGVVSRTLTVGVSPYFAARWLSPRLMSFMQSHPNVQLRIQPMIQFSEQELEDVDLAIRWGTGHWPSGVVTPFMPLRSYPVGNETAAQLVQKIGIERAIAQSTLLRDRDDSTAWSDWLKAAHLQPQSRDDALIITDPNVRVQAVIDGQGIALMDDFVQPELAASKLFRLSETALCDYGYFLFRPHRVAETKTVLDFASWLRAQD